MSARRAVFLDRDGVLNLAVLRENKPYPPASVSEMKIVPDAPDCLARLRDAGYVLIVVTNQPDVARGTQSRQAIEEMHAALSSAMPLDAIYVCVHDGPDDCSCRKPKPGMLLAAAADWGIDLAQSFMIGDRWRDIDAGASAGCRTVFLDFGYAERGPERPPSITVGSLREGVAWILEESGLGDAGGK